jgi:hypothetical protein
VIKLTEQKCANFCKKYEINKLISVPHARSLKCVQGGHRLIARNGTKEQPLTGTHPPPPPLRAEIS